MAVRVRVIIQLAKKFWSRKDEILHSYGSSSIASLTLKQQEFEVGSLLEIHIHGQYFTIYRQKRSNFWNIDEYTNQLSTEWKKPSAGASEEETFQFN